MSEFPRLFRVRQHFEAPTVEDIPAEVDRQLRKLRLDQTIQVGSTIAITVGSRGIANIAMIVRAIVAHVRELQAKPFIVPAMGSHGGSTAEGQRQVIEGYGVTEEFCGCPIRSSMETVVLGESSLGFNVHFDRNAYEADHVIVCNRVKPHTLYAGQVQSGLIKMMMIGLGKRDGATTYHRACIAHDFDAIADSVAPVILQRGSILAGLAIVENAYDQTGRIESLNPMEFTSREPDLLKLATNWMPRLPFDEADVLLVDEIGKNISGSGMDTNVIGRKRRDHCNGEDERPTIKRIIVRGLTKESKGNALGIGMAELCLQRVIDNMDRAASNVNAVTSSHLTAVMIPMTCTTDEQALSTALKTIGLTAPPDAKVMWIRNTLQVGELECSEAYWNEARTREDLSIVGDLHAIALDQHGSLPRYVWNDSDSKHES